MKNSDKHYRNAEIVEYIFNDNYKLLYDKFTKSELMVNANDRLGYRIHGLNNVHVTAKDILNAKEEAGLLSNKNYPETIIENKAIFANYIKLTNSYNIKPIIVVFPWHKTVRKFYSNRKLEEFKFILNEFRRELNFDLLDLYDTDLPYDCYSDLTHLNFRGAKIISEKIKKYIDALM